MARVRARGGEGVEVAENSLTPPDGVTEAAYRAAVKRVADLIEGLPGVLVSAERRYTLPIIDTGGAQDMQTSVTSIRPRRSK